MKKRWFSFWFRVKAAFHVLTAPQLIIYAGKGYYARCFALHAVSGAEVCAITGHMREIIRDEVQQDITLRQAQEVLQQPRP